MVVIGVSRGVGFLVVIGVLVGALGACSDPVAGNGSLAEDALVPAAPSARPAGPSPGSTAAGPTSTPTPTPTQRRRDPAKVARAVDIRAGDIPGWRLIGGSGTDRNDSFDWVILCARDLGVPSGSMSGAATPDMSADGTARTSQVGTVTGLFPDDAAARRFVALFRSASVARCLAAEATRRWADTFAGSVPGFRPAALPVPGAAEVAGLGTSAARKSASRLSVRFHAIRTGPIVTVLSSTWTGAVDGSILRRVAARLVVRQRAA